MADKVAPKPGMGQPPEWFFPTTRYRGSKRKILSWIWAALRDIPFETALDLFGGTGVVSLLFKRMGKQVTYNDYLRYNHISAVALVENCNTQFTDEDLAFILGNHASIRPGTFITDTFRKYYFLDSENKWLDRTIANISALSLLYSGRQLREKQALALWALGQACLIKRPFNLFHRKNLSLRTRDVERGFGNKSTWETPFPMAMRRFVREANQTVFDNGRKNKALCRDAFCVEQAGYDLVYLDPPYFFAHQENLDYRTSYHFLEGIAQYDKWPNLVDQSSYGLRLKRNGMQWPAHSINELMGLYSLLLDRFRESIIVVSHKSGSLVPVGVIRQLLIERGKQVQTRWRHYSYALSKNNGKPRHNIEWLIVGS
ncbi:MAG TPA: DNA adenine methylase [Anaerolineae bacterium]|nr:DNA adenine methylase [Anaerolineae bacterium]